MGFVCVLESVGHLTADNTLEKFLRWKIALKLDILHSYYGYNMMAYHEMTSYQWHDVTERPPTAIGETVTVIPISYACTAIFGLIPHLNIVTNGWRIYSSTSEGPNRPVNVNTRQGNWLLTQRKASPPPTLYGASTRIWLLHLALWDAWRSCWTEAVNFCRPGDLIWIGRRVTGGADVPYKRICAATLQVEDHSFVC